MQRPNESPLREGYEPDGGEPSVRVLKERMTDGSRGWVYGREKNHRPASAGAHCLGGPGFIERERDGVNPRPASAGARYLGKPGIQEREFYAARGRHTVKRVPLLFSLCTVMLPWQSSIYRFVSDSPSPTPS